MAQKTVYACDRCGATTTADMRTFVVTGRATDGAGGMEDTGEHVDLCPKCWKLPVLHALRNQNVEWNGRFLLWAKVGGKAPPGLEEQSRG